MAAWSTPPTDFPASCGARLPTCRPTSAIPSPPRWRCSRRWSRTGASLYAAPSARSRRVQLLHHQDDPGRWAAIAQCVGDDATADVPAPPRRGLHHELVVEWTPACTGIDQPAELLRRPADVAAE